MDTVLSVCVGLGLSAACGFRIFVPLLVMSLASRADWLTLSGGLDWISSTPALIAFGAATALEIGGYYLPWVDNLLDTIATPAAVVAGILATGATLTDVDPFLKWSVAIVAGGGTAGVFQGFTTIARQVSTLSTGGLGNPVLATAEAGSSALLAVLAVTLPLVAILIVVLLLLFGVKRLLFRRPAARTP